MITIGAGCSDKRWIKTWKTPSAFVVGFLDRQPSRSLKMTPDLQIVTIQPHFSRTIELLSTSFFSFMNFFILLFLVPFFCINFFAKGLLYVYYNVFRSWRCWSQLLLTCFNYSTYANKNFCKLTNVGVKVENVLLVFACTSYSTEFIRMV